MDDPRIGLILENRYRIGGRLAAGGMGVVYRGERLGLAKPVAIKFLHQNAALQADRAARFDREAAAMSRLTHPNLVSIIDFGRLDGIPFLVMDYHPGATLRRALEEGAFRPERAVFVARQLLAGLGTAHSSGVLHRDLKPENVLLVGKPGEDLVKLLDFGLAKLLDEEGAPNEQSVVAGKILGTPQYMSPEQARCERLDARADLYCVGLLVYEMVTGGRPFDGGHDLAVLRRQVEEPPPRPRTLAPHLSPELETVILRALEKDRAKRWASAEEFSEALSTTPEGQRRAPTPTAITVRSTTVPPPDYAGAGSGVLIALLLLLLGAGTTALVAHQRGLIDIPLPDWLADAEAPSGPRTPRQRVPATVVPVERVPASPVTIPAAAQADSDDAGPAE